jgi:hypothetical protein
MNIGCILAPYPCIYNAFEILYLTRWRGGAMTQKAMKKLGVLCRATALYSPDVHKKLSGDGKNVALTQSAAKYYVALKKLAEK